MKIKISSLFCLSLCVIVNSCTNVKHVAFITPVDTKTQTISMQKKQVYELNDLGVFVSNDFDGARLNGLNKVNDSTATVVISPENTPINNSAYYAFNAWSNAPKTFYFKFQYPKKYTHRYTPKIKIDNNWTILDTTAIIKKDSNVVVKLNLSREPILIAAQIIESSSDVKEWYTNLIKNKEEFVTLKSAGRSKLGRDLPVLDIYKGDKRNKKIIVLLTRQHPPEVTGYYAFQSFLQTILNESKLSNEFFEQYRVLAFPIINPDGVDLGHWRHNAGGIDLNRDWSFYRQPEVRNVVSFINKTSKKDSGKIILGIDFHSTWKDVFYTNKKREGTTLPNFVDVWFRSLEKNIPNYKVNEESQNSLKPVSKGWFLNGYNAVGITYEIGDATPKKSIDLFGSVSAEQMMSILLTK